MSAAPKPAFNRRLFLSLSAAGASAAALAACGGPSTEADTPVEEDELDFSGVTPAPEITFWSSHPGQSEAIETEIIEKFHASQSAIRVNMVSAGSNYEEVAQKFQTTQQGGDLPAIVIFSDVWWFRYFLNESIIPLDALMEQLDFDTADYRDQLFSDYKYDGRQWAVPFARSTPLFYYNKEHWAAAGLPNRAPETWQEFSEWAPKIKAAVPGIQHVYQHPALIDYAGWTLQNQLWGEGAAWSDEWTITAASDEAVTAIQQVQDTVYRDAWAGVSSKDATADMAAGAVSAAVGSTGNLVGVLKTATFDVGVGFMPGGSRELTGVCPTGGAGLGIPKDISPEQQLAAATFLKFLTSPENTAAFSAATGYMPVRKSADMTKVLAATPQIQTAIDQLAVTRNQDYARVFLPGADQEIAKAAGRILTEQADVKTTLTELSAILEGIYTNDVKPKLPA
ncbi:ABC transporter substrate-binding protein [Arthrobacter sp. zg-Y895]|uniref:ABC transporter substrate-binding protein n=1 Tax=Arthrobacter sp. zg-Y895 TaxID=2886933 RepID=UPI001D14B34A|nr:ABC transporter substrate-binding protein [Arthrobacter sp. zg-Y895]MCC3302359.1 ABC transporter substrate-binding protein [Arthrobacter sp. zg-Y895]